MDPLPRNPVVEKLNSVIHSAIMDVALEAAIHAAETAQPWLNLPIVSTLLRWALNYLFSFCDKYLERVAAFAVIDSQTSQEAADYLKAVQALKEGAPDAEDQFKTALGKLIHWDGG